MYRLIRSFLYSLDPEKAHNLTFRLIKTMFRFPFVKAVVRLIYEVKDPRLEKKVLGLTFPNPVGLAAGLDKNAFLFDELSCFGFGSVEIGTVTPKGQPGNPKPRLFRLTEDEALINRMGFNNEGTENIISRLRKKRSNIIIGGNIGKNKDTPNEQAGDDYEQCFKALYDYVDYFVVNVSSPNTPNLRELQEKEPLKKLLHRLQSLNEQASGQKPVLLKIAPDLSNSQLDDIIEIVRECKIDGIIATNTTISREGLRTPQATLDKIGNGGLSGQPLQKRSTEIIRYLAERSGKAFVIIGVGGINSPEDALEKLKAGADLVQVYTGFIYKGPALIKQINQAILEKYV